MARGSVIRLTVGGGALALALGMLAVAAPGVRGACGLTQISVDRADAVFVGTLTQVAENGFATFEIEDAWAGENLVVGESVVVETPAGLLQLAPPGSGDQRYVVLARRVGSSLRSGFADCANYPFPWSAEYAAFRPLDAPLPPTEGDPAAGLDPVLVLIGAAALVVLVAALAFRRRSPSRDPG